MLCKPVWLSCILIVGWSVCGGEAAFAQSTQAQTAQSASQNHRAKEVLGSKVSIEGNIAIGKVDDIVFDDEGFVEYLIVENDGKLVTVPWDAAKFNFQDRTAFIRISNEQFQRVPTYRVEEYPVFSNPSYRTETYRYYGLTPRERRVERRIDRRN